MELLDEAVVTLEYTVKELNSILNLLGQLPFVQSVGIINSIQVQAGPQVEKFKDGLEMVAKTGIFDEAEGRN
jgi:hypothetical protein